MNRVILLLCLLLVGSFLYAQAPTVPASNLRLLNIEGDRASVAWTRGDGARRIVVVREALPVSGVPQDGIDYNPDISFGEGDELNSGEFVIYDNMGPSTFLRDLAPATTYHVAVFEYNGTGQATEYLTVATTATFSTLGAPTTNASNITTTNILGHSAEMNWTNGDGNRRLVLLRKGSPVDANPTELTAYNPRTNFGFGSEIGTGNFVIFAGAGSSVIVNKLEPNTTYHGAVHEYNGISGPVYFVPGATFTFTTASRPDAAATEFMQGGGLLEGDRLTLTYRNGNGSHRLIVGSASPITWTPTDNTFYTGDLDFGEGEEVSPGVFALQDVANISAGFRSLQGRMFQPATTYHFAIFEYNRSDDGTLVFYQSIPAVMAMATTASAPAAAPTNLTFTDNTGNSIRLDWAASDALRYLVVAKANGPVDFVPTDLTFYSTNTQFGRAGVSDLGNGNYALFKSSLTGFNIVGLEAATEYHIAIFAYNGSNGPVYLSTPARASFTSLATPSESTSNLNFRSQDGDRFTVTYTPGNGARQLIVARQGQAVTAEPVDGTTYAADDFGVGSEISPGQFVVFDGTYNRFVPPTIAGLLIGTEYHLAVYEYNVAPDGTQFYRRTDPGRGSTFTVTIPTLTSPSVSLTMNSSNTAQLTIAAGDGSDRLVIMKKSTAVDFVPDQLVDYPRSTSFGSRSVGNGNFGIARLTSNPQRVDLRSLEPNTVYHVAVFELNGRTHPAYLQTPTTFSFTTALYPTQNTRSLSASSIGATQLSLSWSPGNGNSRIIVARPSAAPEVVPLDQTTYQPGIFGSGDATGADNFVVHAQPGGSNFSQVRGLASGTEYVFTFYERATNSVGEVYYAIPGASITVTTVAQPSITPVNLQANNITPTAATIAWTTGDGFGEAILISANAPVNALLQDGNFVTPRNTFGNGGIIGNARSIYFGNRTTIDVNGLTPGTPYYVQAQAYNGTSQSPAYNQTGVTTMFRTPGPPSLQAVNANITFADATRISCDWENGNGIGRIVLAKEGAPVDAVPVDGADYFPNTFFGSGDEIGTGNFVVALDDLDTLTISNLAGDAVYHFAVFEYNGVGGNRLYNIVNPARTSVQAALPVEWLSFTGEATGKGAAILRWATAQESGSARFVVEHSQDGRSFRPVGNVAAAGRSTERKDYVFEQTGLTGGDHYFRLRQEDLDGAFAYSLVVRLAIIGNVDLVVYPNPTAAVLRVASSEPLPYRVLDGYGRVVRSGVLTESISVADLAKGTYVLELAGERVRFVKQ